MNCDPRKWGEKREREKWREKKRKEEWLWTHCIFKQVLSVEKIGVKKPVSLPTDRMNISLTLAYMHTQTYTHTQTYSLSSFFLKIETKQHSIVESCLLMFVLLLWHFKWYDLGQIIKLFGPQFQFSSVQLLGRVWLCDPMNLSTPGLPVHHQLLEFTQTPVHWVGDAI